MPAETDPSVRQLVAHLRRLKDRSGLSLAALETRTGCSRSSWERYLGGRALPSRRAVQDLCELSGTDPVRLLALLEVATTVWDRSAASAAEDDEADGTAPATGEDRAGAAIEARSVGRAGFAVVVTAAFAGAAVAGVCLGLKPWQEARAATQAAPTRCDVRSEEGALYAGHSRTWKQTIGLGYVGEEVAEAECLLSHHGYDSGPLDGLYDIATHNAAKRAQREAGLPTDGLIGRDTWPALRREG